MAFDRQSERLLNSIEGKTRNGPGTSAGLGTGLNGETEARMADIIKRLEAQINRMTTDGEVEQAAVDEIEHLRTSLAEALEVGSHLMTAAAYERARQLLVPNVEVTGDGRLHGRRPSEPQGYASFERAKK